MQGQCIEVASFFVIEMSDKAGFIRLEPDLDSYHQALESHCQVPNSEDLVSKRSEDPADSRRETCARFFRKASVADTGRCKVTYLIIISLIH